MTVHLQVSLTLEKTTKDGQDAFIPKIGIVLPNTCYSLRGVSNGLAHGTLGIPELDYVSVDLNLATDRACGQVVHTLHLCADAIIPNAAKRGLVVNVYVNDEQAGSAFQSFPSAPAGLLSKQATEVPTAISGTVSELPPISTCMDGAAFALHTATATNRLKAANPGITAQLEQFSKSGEKVTVIGFPSSGPECAYILVLGVTPASKVIDAISSGGGHGWPWA